MIPAQRHSGRHPRRILLAGGDYAVPASCQPAALRGERLNGAWIAFPDFLISFPPRWPLAASRAPTGQREAAVHWH